MYYYRVYGYAKTNNSIRSSYSNVIEVRTLADDIISGYDDANVADWACDIYPNPMDDDMHVAI